MGTEGPSSLLASLLSVRQAAPHPGRHLGPRWDAPPGCPFQTPQRQVVTGVPAAGATSPCSRLQSRPLAPSPCRMNGHKAE